MRCRRRGRWHSNASSDAQDREKAPEAEASKVDKALVEEMKAELSEAARPADESQPEDMTSKLTDMCKKKPPQPEPPPIKKDPADEHMRRVKEENSAAGLRDQSILL